MRRTTFSLPQSWVQELDLTAKSLRVSFTWRKPGDYDSAEAKRQVQKMQMWLVRPSDLCGLYDLRHGWAVCSIGEGLNPSLVAWAIGHDIGVHYRTFHAWLSEAGIRAVLSGLRKRS